MKQPKKNYSEPSADLLVVRFEQNIMSEASTSALPNYTEDFDDWD